MKSLREGRKIHGWIRFFERGLFAPFLFSIQPVLQLYLINLGELNFSEIIRSLLVSLLFGSIVFGVMYLFLRNGLKSSLASSVFILLFFLFGDVADWTSDTFGLGPARTDFLLFMLVSGCVIFWVWLVQNRIRNIATANLYFNLLSILLLVNSGIQVRNHLLDNGISLTPSNHSVPVAAIKTVKPRPDIYYIILDAYGRDDALQAFEKFDNSDFVDALESRGFYVAGKSSSNYIQTLLSLGSSLNMDYVQNLKVDRRQLENRQDLVEILKYSEVRTLLAQNGYRTVSFQNGYEATIPDADIYYRESGDGLVQPVTPFESLAINHSMVRILRHIPALNEILIEAPYNIHRKYILSTFANLQEIPSLDGDYFIYAHIIAPHPPFVFGENGEILRHGEPFTLADANQYVKNHTRKGYITGYRKQMHYINTLMLETLDTIFARSKTPPVIIIQGDHGPGAFLHWASLEETIPAERFSILNAYYFPGQDYASLYPSISPVNSFRVVLNQFFGGNYELIPDRHYYSQWKLPFDFTEVSDLSLP